MARPSLHDWAVLTAISSAAVVTSSMNTLIVPLLPRLPALFGSELTTTSWAGTVTLLAGAVATPIAGRLGDLNGCRRVIIGLLALCLAGSVLAAVATTLPVLLIGRALQGAAVGTVPLAWGALRHAVAPELVGWAVGVLGACVGGSGVAAPLLAAVVLDRWAWPALFWLATGATLLALGLALRYIEDPQAPRASAAGARDGFDVLGALGLSVISATALTLLTRGQAWGWASPRTIAVMVAVAGLTWAWARWELAGRAPLIDLATNLRGPLLVTHVLGAVVGLTLFTQFIVNFTLVTAPVGAGAGFGRSVLLAGLTLLPGSVMMLLAAPIGTRLGARIGTRTTVAVSCAAIAVGFLSGVGLHGTIPGLVLSTLIVYAGAGAAFGCLPVLVMAGADDDTVAAAHGVNALSRIIGGALATAGTSLILSTEVVATAGGPQATMAAFSTIACIAAAIAAVAGGLTLTLPAPTAAPAPSWRITS